jgi:hypothetical protein
MIGTSLGYSIICPSTCLTGTDQMLFSGVSSKSMITTVTITISLGIQQVVGELTPFVE